jgi:hypothetical protein
VTPGSFVAFRVAPTTSLGSSIIFHGASPASVGSFIIFREAPHGGDEGGMG